MAFGARGPAFSEKAKHHHFPCTSAVNLPCFTQDSGNNFHQTDFNNERPPHESSGLERGEAPGPIVFGTIGALHPCLLEVC